MKNLLLSLLSASVSQAERVWLSRMTSIPPPKTLEVVHFLTLDVNSATEVSVAGPVSIEGIEGGNKKAQLSIVPHEALSKLSDSSSTFCCTQAMQTAGKCQDIDKLVLDVPSQNYHSFDITEETLKNGFASNLFKIPTTGLYYVTLSNCGDIAISPAAKFTSGELVAVSKHGYLPGEEAPKQSFYLYLLLAYFATFGVWCVLCAKWSNVLFKIHHYISITILVGLLEATCWYSSLYHWNYIGHRWWSMIALASFGTVCKQGVSYGLLLLACLGLGVTKPRLESRQVVQCFLLVAAFIVTDGIRQMALLLQDRVNGVASTWKILLLVTPGSFFVSVLYVWILQSLQDTIKDLQEKKQSVKLQVYTNLRFALVSVCAVVIAIVGYETIVVRRTELSANWATRYIFTDVLSHCCFMILLWSIMYLWKPSEHSIQMAFSEQLSDGATVGAVEMEAKDFSSVDVELDPEDKNDFSFVDSMKEAKQNKPVLE